MSLPQGNAKAYKFWMCLECSLVRVLLDGPYLKQKQLLKEKKDGLMQNKARKPSPAAILSLAYLSGPLPFDYLRSFGGILEDL